MTRRTALRLDITDDGRDAERAIDTLRQTLALVDDLRAIPYVRVEIRGTLEVAVVADPQPEPEPEPEAAP